MRAFIDPLDGLARLVRIQAFLDGITTAFCWTTATPRDYLGSSYVPTQIAARRSILDAAKAIPDVA
jgi:hypothetical protein